ncbi:MAG TPA: metallophosphoesterase [Vicinamibacterales bacterium]|jgi:hypothetical protein|nr:metallophosphoesterase [Vicinamibacterales bacterium]
MPHHPRPHERLKERELPPPKVAWLHPLELMRTAYHAWLSQVATAYIDRREVLAALDSKPPEIDPAFGVVTPVVGPLDGEPVFSSDHQKSNGVWIDFVADVGDSWEATHAIATLMAKRELDVAGYRGMVPGLERGQLPHADLVVIGGDLVYPTPTRDSYRRRTCEPIGSAFPAREVAPPVKQGEKPPVIRERYLAAIPGNHDWYDGLTSFVREFCQGGSIGGWQLLQARSYFALKLTRRWWIWGIDIALDTRIDPAQQAYFLEVLKNSDLSKHQQFEPGDNVILCTAKPSWLKSSRYSDDSFKNLEFFARELIEGHGGHVAMILSGDLHHYSRYTDEDQHQMITSGSGGAYLMGTHHLPAEVRPFKRFEGEPEEPGPWTDSGFVCSGFPYPSQSDSRRLALGALRLAFRRANIAFSVTVGLISFWMARMVDRVVPQLMDRPYGHRFSGAVEWRFDWLAFVSALVILVGCAWFASSANKRASRFFTYPWGALHGVAHLAVSFLLAVVFMPTPLIRLGAVGPPYLKLRGAYAPVAEVLSTVGDAAVFVLVAGWIGATLVGLYLTLSDRLFRWHHNEVFAAQSIVDYRSFVRIHVDPKNRFTIYPVGLRHVPRSWRSRLERAPSDPHYEPTDAELQPHLIEGPIEVEVAQTRWPSATVAPPASKSVMMG